MGEIMDKEENLDLLDLEQDNEVDALPEAAPPDALTCAPMYFMSMICLFRFLFAAKIAFLSFASNKSLQFLQAASGKMQAAFFIKSVKRLRFSE